MIGNIEKNHDPWSGRCERHQRATTPLPPSAANILPLTIILHLDVLLIFDVCMVVPIRPIALATPSPILPKTQKLPILDLFDDTP